MIIQLSPNELVELLVLSKSSESAYVELICSILFHNCINLDCNWLEKKLTKCYKVVHTVQRHKGQNCAYKVTFFF